ncbi:hypothetical protein [Sodalis-like endosymbiont of Proechinophthirus fluctus]|uniref:hypothetical protein n=1 Tax=Sodalis-like endosymbiont of Proechinophthirus fluctus TaxID=1462730 RepID=UPI00082EFA9D
MDHSFHLLCLSHTFLSYISTLGAHTGAYRQSSKYPYDATCYVDDVIHHQNGDAFQARQPGVRKPADAYPHSWSLEPGAREKLVMQKAGSAPRIDRTQPVDSAAE